jgi:hypothetical protein
MKRVAMLIVALLVLVASSSALGSLGKRCGLVSYSGFYQSHSYSGRDAVLVVRGVTSCAMARSIDRRADEGRRTAGWRCAFSHHETVTTCTSASARAETQGREYTSPPVTQTPAPTPTPPPTTPTPPPTTPTPAPTPTSPTPTSPTPTPTPTGCYPLTTQGPATSPASTAASMTTE